VHAGVERLQHFLLQASANGTRPAWYLQLDVHNYFMSIDKAVLWALLAPRIRDPEVAWLTRLLVEHDCTEGFVYRGKPGLLERVPPHKSLLKCPPGKGLPIGNLNSQFFANVYLNALDQHVKHGLKCRHYLRYCDDFVLVAQDPEELRVWREAIVVFLAERLATFERRMVSVTSAEPGPLRRESAGAKAAAGRAERAPRSRAGTEISPATISPAVAREARSVPRTPGGAGGSRAMPCSSRSGASSSSIRSGTPPSPSAWA
jgi:hypothetical protein